METVGSILVVVLMVTVAAVLFIGWVGFSIIRAVVKAILAFSKPKRPVPPRPAPPPALSPAPMGVPPLKFFPRRDAQVSAGRCPRDNCRAENPAEAQFCRRCGTNLVAKRVQSPPHRPRRMAVGA